jgi:HAD superfamily hydrolase (TIGR01490 family)
VFAFFDLDQTLVPYDTQALFCQFVLQRHGWRRIYLATWLPALPLAGLKLIGHRGLKRVFLNYLWRMPKSELETLVPEFVSTVVMPMVYPTVLAELRQHQANGLITVLNSASPDIYAREIARSLKFDHCFATRIDLGSGDRVRFTPDVIGPNNKGENKLPPMAEILASTPQRPIPGSYAYSDSHADLPLLNLAEHGVMVNPTAKLAAVGHAKGWRTMTPARPFHSKREHHWHTLQQILGLTS